MSSIRYLNSLRWWHRVRGHQIHTMKPNFSDLLEWSQVRQQCTCGDQWVFFALGLYEKYLPAGTRG